MAKRPILFLVAVFFVVQAKSAVAQEHGSDLRLFGQFNLGLAGNVSTEIDTAGLSSENEYDLDPSIGFGAGVDFGLIEYLAVGGILRYFIMSPDTDVALSWSVIDIDALPRIRYPFEQFELYLGIPVGLTIFIPEEGDAEVGWNLSFVLGGLYRVSEKFGLYAEAGYFLHFYSTSEESGLFETSTSYSIGQIGISIGAAYMN